MNNRHVNIEAEKMTIGTMIYSEIYRAEILEMLTPDDFVDQKHRRIFNTIKGMFLAGDEVNYITVPEKMRNGDSGIETPATYIADIASPMNVDIFGITQAKIVLDLSQKRRFLVEAHRIIGLVESTGIDESIAAFNDELFRTAGAAAGQPIGSTIEETALSAVERSKNGGGIAGLPTGYPDIDRVTGGLQRQDLVILAARPSMGKTALATNIAENLARNGHRTLFFSLEMGRKQLSARHLARFAGINLQSITNGRLSASQSEKILQVSDEIKSMPIYVDDRAALTIAQMMAKAKAQKARTGLDLIIVDYIQLAAGDGQNRTEEVSSISRGLKAMAKNLDVPVLALSQLNRMVEHRPDKRPVMSDLRDSGAIEQDADIISFLYRDEYYHKEPENPKKGKAELIIAKQRNGPTDTLFLSSCNLHFSEFLPFAKDQSRSWHHAYDR